MSLTTEQRKSLRRMLKTEVVQSSSNKGPAQFSVQYKVANIEQVIDALAGVGGEVEIFENIVGGRIARVTNENFYADVFKRRGEKMGKVSILPVKGGDKEKFPSKAEIITLLSCVAPVKTK